MELLNTDIALHIIGSISFSGKFIVEYLLKLQAYPSYAGRHVWEEILRSQKEIALALAKELGLLPQAEHEDAETLYDYLQQDAFAGIGLGWLEYGPQEGLIDSGKVKAELKVLSQEMANVMKRST